MILSCCAQVLRVIRQKPMALQSSDTVSTAFYICAGFRAEDHGSALEKRGESVVESAVFDPGHRMSADEMERSAGNQRADLRADFGFDAAGVEQDCAGLKAAEIFTYKFNRGFRIQRNKDKVACAEVFGRRLRVDCADFQRLIDNRCVLVRADHRMQRTFFDCLGKRAADESQPADEDLHSFFRPCSIVYSIAVFQRFCNQPLYA